MKRINKLLIILFIATMAMSCSEDVLDIKPTDFISDATLWESEGAIKQFTANIYGSLETPFTSYGDLWNIPAFSHIDLATDDAMPKVDVGIRQLTRGEVSAAWCPYGHRTWQHNYEIIRKTHILIDGLDNVDETILSAEQKTQYKAEGRFIRAFMYFELVRMFDGVPLITELMSLEDDNFPARNSADEVFNFIFDECDDIAGILLLEPESGRVSKGAALALLSRAKLYYASPLFNSGGDASRWSEAASASKAVMNLGKYSLYNDYRNLFLKAGEGNDEIIWARQYKFPEMAHIVCMLWGFHTAGGINNGTWGGFYPSQNLIDAYEMTNGKPITDPESGYNPQAPYTNRDPRLGMTVVHNGATWRDDITIEFFEGGNADPDIYSAGGVATGYGLRKFDEMVPNNVNYYSGEYSQENDWIYFRYAEILLNYAEAQNEAQGPDASVYDAINTVRARTGVEMPELPAGLSKEEMREKIRQERRIELVYESHRFFDVRRWDVAMEVLNSDIHRVKIVKDAASDELTYSYPVKEQRTYLEHQKFLPIPLQEIEKNANLTQNPGY